MKSYYNCTTPADWHNLVAGWIQGPNYHGELDNEVIYGLEIPYGQGEFSNVVYFEEYINRGNRSR